MKYLMAAFVLCLVNPIGCLHKQVVVRDVQDESSISALLRVAVKIETESGSGSGVAVGPRRILTALHVVSGRARIFARSAYTFCSLKMVKADPMNDLALMESSCELPLWASVATGDLWVGQRCTAVGYQNGLDTPTVTDGRLQETDLRIRYSAPGWMGSSGGPVFVRENGRWRIVSVTLAVYVGGPGIPIVALMLGAPREAVSGLIGG